MGIYIEAYILSLTLQQNVHFRIRMQRSLSVSVLYKELPQN